MSLAQVDLARFSIPPPPAVPQLTKLEAVVAQLDEFTLRLAGQFKQVYK